MKKAIIAKKIGMTQVFTENGALVPVTVLEAGPCVVIQKKTMENDGYAANYEVGAEIKADVFAAGDRVDASGVSKGKGFQSTIKRYNASRGPMGHGSKSHRVVGSMGSSAYPSRVKKGKRMPGHMGSANVTIQNLEIVRADAEKNLLLIKAAVPGPKGSVLVIKDSVKA